MGNDDNNDGWKPGDNLGDYLGNPVKSKSAEKQNVIELSEEQKHAMQHADPVQAEEAKKALIEVIQKGKKVMRAMHTKTFRNKKETKSNLKNGVTGATYEDKKVEDIDPAELEWFAKNFKTVASEVTNAAKAVLNIRDVEPKAKTKSDQKKEDKALETFLKTGKLPASKTKDKN
jgi:hypothetical protein